MARRDPGRRAAGLRTTRTRSRTPGARRPGAPAGAHDATGLSRPGRPGIRMHPFLSQTAEAQDRPHGRDDEQPRRRPPSVLFQLHQPSIRWIFHRRRAKVGKAAVSGWRTTPTRRRQPPATMARATGATRCRGPRVERCRRRSAQPARPAKDSSWRSTSARMTRPSTSPWHPRHRRSAPACKCRRRDRLVVLPILDGSEATAVVGARRMRVEAGSLDDTGAPRSSHGSRRAVSSPRIEVTNCVTPLAPLYRVEHARAQLGRSRSIRNSGNGPQLTENPTGRTIG